MFEIKFNVAGEEQYARAFDVMANEVTRLKDPLSRVSEQLTRSVGEQFETEGAHGTGAKWTELNKAYEDWKDEHYPGRPMLVRTGAMRRAFLVDGERELTDERLIWGVDTQTDDDGEAIAARAAAHQTGDGVPERKIIALTKADRRAIDRSFVEWFNGVRHSLLGEGPL